jgi:hypothetical protein
MDNPSADVAAGSVWQYFFSYSDQWKESHFHETKTVGKKWNPNIHTHTTTTTTTTPLSVVWTSLPGVSLDHRNTHPTWVNRFSVLPFTDGVFRWSSWSSDKSSPHCDVPDYIIQPGFASYCWFDRKLHKSFYFLLNKSLICITSLLHYS